MFELHKIAFVIKSEREKRGWTQADLASVIGVSREAISLTEGNLRHSIKLLIKIANAFDLKFSTFIQKCEDFKN